MKKKSKPILPTSPLVSINAYARSKGIDPKTMRQNLRRVGLRGRVDPSVADPLLAAMVSARHKNETMGKEDSFSEAERRLKWAKVAQEELKLKKIQGTLVVRTAVDAAVFALIRQSRDRLQNIPDRVAGICAGESDQLVIHSILTKEIHAALEELSHATPC